MKLLSTVLARVAARLAVEELTPQGHLLGPEITTALVEKCGFAGFPKGEDHVKAIDTGLTYQLGKWGDIAILKLSIFPGVIAVDTASSTEDSKRALVEILDWAKGALSIQYEPSMLKNTGYLSQLTVEFDTPLESLNPSLRPIANKLTESVSSRAGFQFTYGFSSLVLSFDQTNIKPNAATFTVERRIETPFSENIYFSQAPLSTPEHMDVLQELESAL